MPENPYESPRAEPERKGGDFQAIGWIIVGTISIAVLLWPCFIAVGFTLLGPLGPLGPYDPDEEPGGLGMIAEAYGRFVIAIFGSLLVAIVSAVCVMLWIVRPVKNR